MVFINVKENFVLDALKTTYKSLKMDFAIFAKIFVNV